MGRVTVPISGSITFLPNRNTECKPWFTITPVMLSLQRTELAFTNVF